MVEHGAQRLARRRVAASSNVERHRLRTPRPDAFYVLTRRERDSAEVWLKAWERNRHHGIPLPPFQMWREAVQDWAKANGVQVTFTTEENPATMETIIRWRWREEPRRG